MANEKDAFKASPRSKLNKHVCEINNKNEYKTEKKRGKIPYKAISKQYAILWGTAPAQSAQFFFSNKF